MAALIIAFTVLAVLPLVLYFINPYFWEDFKFAVTLIRIGVRLNQIGKKFYSVLDCFLDKVASHPHKTFLLFEESSYSYSQADKESSKAARALSGCLEPGDTVALLLGNEPMFVFLWLAAAKLGCTAALLNCNLRSKSLLHCFSCCDAKVLVAGADLKAAVEEILPTLKEQGIRVFILSEHCDVEGIESLSDKINNASDEPLSPQLRANLTLKSPALYIFTSGTTGLPKAAVIDHDRIWKATFLQFMVGVRSDDIVYINLPLYHTAGFLMGLTGAINLGITIVLRRKFSASNFWDDCRKHNVTVIQYIGEIMRYLCNTPKKDNDRDHKVRLAVGNGIRADAWAEFLQRFGDIRVCECYGATEGNAGFVNYIGKIGAIGKEHFLYKKTCPYSLIRYDTEKEEPVRDSKGFCMEVPVGETGLLIGKIGKGTEFTGYAKNKQQTEKKKLRDVFVKGDLYFNSGDLLRIDKEGFVYFQDRIGDTFRWKGENVATTEVADHLVMLDSVEEANVYGVKVPGHEGRIGMAALRLKENMDFDGKAIYQHVKNCLPSYARPRFIRLQDALAVTGTYKPMKMKLAEEGFNPAVIENPLFFLQDGQGYIPMTQEIFNSITEGSLRL
ncbi:very long-chain acyl-CoA synthetase-like [Salarias fasciatus]|uniref:very long-chain acyl-CoA synthetase-like n=1 Tax=Salarias fasciatus TaxID=181472 RepID=UPI0011769071|nr:very long-chain acyl-CoA synthetase-like [Salarias fasciatus]